MVYGKYRKNENAEVSAATEHALSDETIEVILEREAYAEQNPDCRIPYEQAMKELCNA